jgi:hypothetical protein
MIPAGEAVEWGWFGLIDAGSFVTEEASAGFQQLFTMGEVFWFGGLGVGWIALGMEPSCQMGSVLGLEVEVGHRI